MNRKLLFCTLICVQFRMLSAQSIVEGLVTDSLSHPLDAYIMLAAHGSGTILAWADTDPNGYYRLSFSTDADSLTVTASSMIIGHHVRVVPNRSQTLNFVVTPQTFEIAEVSVKADKIRQTGDTIDYNVAAYTQQGDRVIGDVLRRMPGIEVADNGTIKYNGKAINKFYVEEMDLLQGRYGIATNNINAGDVATVQVLEHHQPKKMLQGKSITDDVAINLKLKDSAKGTVAVNSMLGAGVGSNPLWSAELVGMYFGKARQNMTLYKGNNTGDDVSAELASHYGINSVGLYPFCPTGVIMPGGSGLPQKRTFDNRSHIVSMNHLRKLNADKEVTFNIGYYTDRIGREGFTASDQFVSESQRLITQETMTSRTTLHNLSAQARYCNNSPTGFMADVMQVDAGWNTDRVGSSLSSSLTGQTPADYGASVISQHFHRPTFSITNTINTTQNIGRNTFDLHFSAGYAHRPNTLSVGIDSLLQATSARYQQDVNSHHIAGRFNTSYNIRVGDFFKFNYGISATANLHGIETDLAGWSSASQLNSLWYNTYSLSLGQSYKYERGVLRATLGLPLNLYMQSLDDHIRHDRHSYTHLLFFPSLSLSWDVMRDVYLTAGADYSKTVGDPGGIYSGYIMSNYRTFQRSYVEQLSETKNYGANLSLRYRSALHALFANMAFSYRRTRDNQIYGYSYEGATSVVQAFDQPTTSDSYSISTEASKGFDFMRSTIRIFANYSLGESERLIADNIYKYRTTNLNYGGNLSFSPTGWMGIMYSSGFSRSQSKNRSQDDAMTDGATVVRSNTQRLSMSLYPTKTLTLTLSAEDNYNNLTAENRHAWFGDVSAKLKLKYIDLELQMNNLFNQRRYTRVTYSGLDIYTQTSQLRERSAVLSVRFKLL
ncbi:MAG: hypothetical protein II750_02460 [Bacteroidaceae bacterium]|nr:hypothetical protein [Bacteroidaceae bacterium]